MAARHDLPIYNLKAVVQETGIKPDTLRAWERRYGLPEPQRTASGHRLYTERDVATLKWLVARQDDGLTISRAVALWHELRRQGNDPLEHVLTETRPGETSRTPISQSMPSAGASSTITQLKRQWIEACLHFDERDAEQALNGAFALFPVESVTTSLIQQGLAEIGEGWLRGSVTAQQEHFASALAMRRLETLLAATPAPTRNGRILVACPPHESHVFAPLMLSLFLRRRGWYVVYLGADVPLQSLEATIDATAPALVILAAQQLHTAAGLLEMGRLLEERRVPLAYGGLVFNQSPYLRTIIPGHFLGERIDEAVPAVERIMQVPHVHASLESVPTASLAALRRFRELRSAIEADVRGAYRNDGLSPARVGEANALLGSYIEAALALGSFHRSNADDTWLKNLPPLDRVLPDGKSAHYHRTYILAALGRLGSEDRQFTGRLAELAGLSPNLDVIGHTHELPKKVSRVKAIGRHRRS